MSDGTIFKVPYTKILNITPHLNAERLEVATIYGFQVIIPKDKYKIGDEIVYVPIDSILESKLEAKLFPEGSKIVLHHHRIRQIKIRGLASQGMVINKEDLSDIVNFEYIKLETDLSAMLKITKYDPPASGLAFTQPKPGGRKKLKHPDFHEYNGLNNIKWLPDFFKDGDKVVVQEKLHGTNARAGKLPFRSNTLMKKIKKLFGFAPEVENVYGSNRVDISNASTYKGYYNDDVYGKCFKNSDVFSKLNLGETVFGEIVGPGIQKGYGYGLTEHKFVLFDVKILKPDGTQIWLGPDEVEAFAKERGFLLVPILYKGPYNKELTYQLTKGKSEFNDKSEKVREGIVIKAMENYSIEGNKQGLKWVSEDYLSDAKNTDNH